MLSKTLAHFTIILDNIFNKHHNALKNNALALIAILISLKIT